MSRLVLFGASGQLGQDLAEVLRETHEVWAFSREECDVTNTTSVHAAIEKSRPDWVVNCSAFTAVDAAETREPEALEVNGRAVERLGALAREQGWRLLHYSTDYVFDGGGTRPYREDDPVAPQSAYGRTKLEGERAVLALDDQALVLRTQWLYGPTPRNFVQAILRRAHAGEPLKVVADQHGCPTYTADVARATSVLLEREAHGLYHVANGGETTWFGFAEEILALTGLKTSIEPCPTDRSRYPAPRPSYSVLDTANLTRDTGFSMPAWQDGLKRYLARIGEAA